MATDIGRFRVLGTVLLLTAAAMANAAEPIPAEHFAQVPMIQQVSMSADGRNLVALVASPGSDNQETALATWNLDDPDKGPVITPSGNRMKFIAASAMKADRVLVMGRQEWTGQLGGCGEGSRSGATKTFVTKAYLTDSGHKSFSEAFADNTRRIGISEQTQRCMEIAGTAGLVHQLPLDPENVIVSQINSASLSANYLLYNLRTDQTTLLFRASGRSSPGLFNPRNGEVLTRVELKPDSRDFEQEIQILNPDTGEFELHENLNHKLTDRHTIDFIGLDEDTGNYYVRTDLFSDRIEVRVYDPRARKFDDEPLVAHPEFGIGGLIRGTHEENFGQILGFVVDGAQREQVFVDPEMDAIHAGLKQAFPDQAVWIDDYDVAKSRLLFTTSSARHPMAYHLLIDGERVMTLGSERPWIDPEQIGEQRWVTYPARDGLQIPAILDLPAGWTDSDGPLPAIIHPHGGPWARDWAGWDRSGWVPFLTSRGYAVLRPQYRGSAGLGRDLWIAGDAEWGQKMQDDKDDGAAWLVNQGIADPSRIAIFGYSYGGFAAAAAAVRPDGPYRCAISGAPVTDLDQIGRLWSQDRVQRILQGRTVKGMSPLANAANANIPVLLMVGDRDVRTPAFHSSRFYNAIKDRVTARYELIPDMPHSMPWYPGHQMATLGMIEEFLEGPCRLGHGDSVAGTRD